MLRYPTLYFASAILILLASCGDKKSAENSNPVQIDTLTAFILKKDTLNSTISFPGELIPWEKAEISAKVTGYVDRVLVDIGDEVRHGQLLLILSAPEAEADYKQAASDVQMARSKFMGSADAYKRIMKASAVEGTVAAGEIERIKSQMLSDSAALNASRSKMKAFEQLKDYLAVRAPFSGTVTARNVDPGSLVGANNTQVLFIVENKKPLRLRLSIPEVYAAAAPAGAKVHFTVDAYPGDLFEAKLSRKSGAFNANNRTETWEFLYPNAENKLKSGMFAQARLSFTKAQPTFVLPKSAIVTNQEKRFIIRYRHGKAEWIDVRKGIEKDDRSEIFGSLSEGDTIVLKGTDEIQPDKEIRVRVDTAMDK